MQELLEKIDQTFDSCMETSSEDAKLQLRIIKGNIHTIIQEYMEKNGGVVEQPVADTPTVEEDFSKKRIFIVDDSSIVRNYLEKLLKEHYRIDMAMDGGEAIEKLSKMEENNGYDAILLDLMMPNIDGFGVLEYLQGKNISIPVVVISGDTTGETITRAFQYNVVDMIEKPFDSKTIEEKIGRILGGE